MWFNKSLDFRTSNFGSFNYGCHHLHTLLKHIPGATFNRTLHSLKSSSNSGPRCQWNISILNLFYMPDLKERSGLLQGPIFNKTMNSMFFHDFMISRRCPYLCYRIPPARKMSPYYAWEIYENVAFKFPEHNWISNRFTKGRRTHFDLSTLYG